MAADLKLFQNYIHAIEKALAVGDATEHTHRSALKALFESLETNIAATNEPKHIECGAPDFILRKGSVTFGYIEAKDIGKSLDEAEKTDQLKRYRDSLPTHITRYKLHAQAEGLSPPQSSTLRGVSASLPDP